MKYTVTIIDTEEKFREKFGSDPQWVISTPRGKNIEKSVDRYKGKRKKEDQEIK